MKKLILAAAICGLTSQGVLAQEGNQPELNTGDLSYMLGYDVGSRLSDMEIELDYDRFLNAVKAAMGGEDSALSEEQLQAVRTAFNAQQQALMAKKNEDRRKMLAVKAAHPNIDIRLCFQNAKVKLSRAPRSLTYGQWADRHGFVWCQGHIPTTWFDERTTEIEVCKA